MNYHHEIKQAKELLDKEAYNLCAIQCGRILEALLRDLLNEIHTHPIIYRLNGKTKFLISTTFLKTTKKTLGNLIYILSKSNAIELLSKNYHLESKEFESVNLSEMLSIRNKASHDGNDDSSHHAGADAYIIYGYILKFWGLIKHIPIFETDMEIPPRRSKNDTYIVPKKNRDPKQPRTKTKYANPLSIKSEPIRKHKDVISKNYIEICKNKESGEKFVFLEERLYEKASFILPNGTVKDLPLKLFNEVEEVEEWELSEKQLQTLKIVKDHENIYPKKGYTKNHKEKEPDYIQKYRNMLKNPGTIPSIMLDIVKSNGSITWIKIKNELMNVYGYRYTGSFGASLRVLKIDGYVKVQGTGEDKIISFSR